MIRSTSIREPILISLFLVAALRAGAAVPDCASPPAGLRIPMEANLPFTAGFVEEQWNELPDGSDGPSFKSVYSIARDSSGRVSTKGSGTTKAGIPLWFTVEICDPIEGTMTHFQKCPKDANDPASSNGCAIERVAKVRDGPRRNSDWGPPEFPDPFKPLPPHHSSELVTNIQQVEPDPELFQVPSDYEIVRVPGINPQSLPRRQPVGGSQTQ